MARQKAVGLLGIHINLPAAVPPEVAAVLGGGVVPPRLSEKDRSALAAQGEREEGQCGVLHDPDRAAADR
jgi:hypothetical protein